MLDNLKKILNEDQDPKAIEKITAKLENLLMSNEEVGYIAVQKKPAVNLLPDSVVVTNKRIILCKPKNLGLTMEFNDFNWDDVIGTFIKEGILGAEFTFQTEFELSHTIDYLPKNQARKLYTYAKEQMDLLKRGNTASAPTQFVPIDTEKEIEQIEEVEAEEVKNFAEIMPVSTYAPYEETKQEPTSTERKLNELSQEELFEKLQNYKKLLDNGLILQGEYDALKKEILNYM